MLTVIRNSGRRSTDMILFAFIPLLALQLAGAVALAAEGELPDLVEPGSVEAIASATTDSRFISPWVAFVPDSDVVPSPSDYLGRIAGAPGLSCTVTHAIDTSSSAAPGAQA